VNHVTQNEHPTAERLQAFLEGDLPEGERPEVERHLTACTHCSAELDAWRVLVEDLGALASLEPRAGFADRVMAGVRVSAPLPLAARVRARLRTLLPSSRPAHVSGEVLQDFLEGALPARRAARVGGHLGDCPACAASASSWRDLFGALDGLGRLAPSHGFMERVLARVRTAAPASSAASAPARSPARAWERGLAWGLRLVPRTRRAWAALSGIAVTPAVTGAVLLYAVFSHPTLTPRGLLAFAWWQVSDVAATAGSALAATTVESDGLFGLYALLQTLASAPLALAGGVGAYLIFSALALRVLYKNLISRRPVDGPYAHASAS
jgi:anti-sigma factor RsiW